MSEMRELPPWLGAVAADGVLADLSFSACTDGHFRLGFVEGAPEPDEEPSAPDEGQYGIVYVLDAVSGETVVGFGVGEHDSPEEALLIFADTLQEIFLDIPGVLTSVNPECPGHVHASIEDDGLW